MGDDTYASERHKPELPACGSSAVRLEFDGAHLWMHGIRYIESPRHSAVLNGKPLKYPAVSGKPVHGRFIYTRARQTRKNEGPIPEGRYWITPSELWSANIVHWLLGMTDSWGEFRISIHPYPTTPTHGRGGFFIHGGDEAGSAGCIDLTHHMTTFVNNLRGGVKETQCHIPLTVAYPTDHG